MAYAVTIENRAAPHPRACGAASARGGSTGLPSGPRSGVGLPRTNPGLRTDGHNVFHYDHASAIRPDSKSTRRRGHAHL